MKKYILIDDFEGTIRILYEKELRDLYNTLMDETIFNWKDCEDEKIQKDLKKEKEEVYTTDIENVIRAITDIDNYYRIIVVKEYNNNFYEIIEGGI